MPAYDYHCGNCGHAFEEVHTISECSLPTNEPCPKCGEPEVRIAIMTVPSFGDPAKLGIQKPDREFRNLLKTIKKRNRGGGNIDRYAT